MANHNNHASDEVISLNVGGVIHITTRSTLAKYPDSMLGSMFSDRFVPQLDNQSNYFIDRDGHLFRHILNFLRTGSLCLPQDFQDFDLLDAEADFYQIPSLIAAITSLRCKNKHQTGHYLEILDFEETSYFCRFYSDPPRGINAEQQLKNGGIVISGATSIMKTLPLPEKTLKDLERCSDNPYRTVNINSNSVSKMAIIHHLHANGWELLKTSFANNHDKEGSYMVHKYMWFLPT